MVDIEYFISSNADEFTVQAKFSKINSKVFLN